MTGPVQAPVLFAVLMMICPARLELLISISPAIEPRIVMLPSEPRFPPLSARIEPVEVTEPLMTIGASVGPGA